MDAYNQKQTLLKSQAAEVLTDLNLIKFLSKFGKVEIVGSYYLDLMTWKDIDIVVCQNPDYEDFLETTAYLFNQEKVYNLTLQDYRKSIHADRPQGIYLGIKYLFDRTKGWDEMWKIYIWFLPEGQNYAIEKRDYVNSKLNQVNRDIILKIKNEMREKTLHGKDISGGDVYSAVIDQGVKDLNGFREYLEKQGRAL